MARFQAGEHLWPLCVVEVVDLVPCMLKRLGAGVVGMSWWVMRVVVGGSSVSATS